jgi:hypothetical protein
MEKLTINIPKKKSVLVKQILTGLGVTFQQDTHKSTSSYKEKLAKSSTWSDADLQFFVNLDL